MPPPQQQMSSEQGSEYNQISFIGGMNLLLDDTRLGTNQYRIGFDLTNRLDALDPVLASVEDLFVPKGIIQECVTFGQYVILFVSGKAWYRYYTDLTWTLIPDFVMSTEAPRFWTCSVPVGLTNYIRIAKAATGYANISDARLGVQQLNLEGAAEGNLPGLVVQDNINQPLFLFISGGKPVVRKTQTFADWRVGYTSTGNVLIGAKDSVVGDSTYDLREYIPVGNSMCWSNGIMFITAQDFNSIYRSVSGRPLDFVVNVTNVIQTNPSTIAGKFAYWQMGGGDATSTSYSVGVGGISCIRPLATGGIFVSASNANFAVTLNQSQNAPTEFGEYTFNRAFLFNATCLSDRTIIDTLGDTRFIELTGIRSFNAVAQLQNQGRNSVFSNDIQGAFGPEETPLIQPSDATAAILYNNYELYSVKTLFGDMIAKYDTVNECWTSFDKQQTGGKAVKIFAKIELTALRLYAVTTDNRFFTLYVGPAKTTPTFRTIGICSSVMYAGQTIKTSTPKIDLKLNKTRVILNGITEDCTCTFTPYFNNRLGECEDVVKSILFETPTLEATDPLALPDVGTQLMNLLWPTPDIEQGWKYFATFSWTNGSLVQFSMELDTITPMNSAYSQGLTQ